MAPERKHNILYIDDEANNLLVFKNVFFRHYNVFTAQSGQEGLNILDREDIHVVITDQKMPGMTGVEFLEKAIEQHPNVVRMVLTAYSDIDLIMRAINRCGIYQYILKPWDNRQLKITIDNAIQKYELSSENKSLIRSLEEANKALEAKVAARTAELASQNEELTQLNAVKDKLFSILSHDLKMPTAALNVLLDLLIHFNEQMDAQKLLEFSQKSKRYVQHVIDLMDNLLSWSMSQTGTLKINNQKVEISEILKELEGIFSFIASQKNQIIEFSSPKDAIVLNCDKDITLLILRNLISNAIKFTNDAGKILVTVEPNGAHYTLKVVDEGVGISQDIIDDISMGIFPESSIGTKEEKGVGLGLKLCQEFAQLQAGDLNISSKPGKGTTVSLSLPKAIAE